MTREEYLNQLIHECFPSVRQFALQIGMPPATLRHILSGGLPSTSLDKIESICAGLGITLADILDIPADTSATALDTPPMVIKTEQEKQLVLNYRQNTSMQAAVNKLLDIEGE